MLVLGRHFLCLWVVLGKKGDDLIERLVSEASILQRSLEANILLSIDRLKESQLDALVVGDSDVTESRSTLNDSFMCTVELPFPVVDRRLVEVPTHVVDTQGFFVDLLLGGLLTGITA